MYICPVCGYNELSEPPYDIVDGSPSYEVCPSCGFEFGFDDLSENKNFEEYRNNWIVMGANWWATDSNKPKGWNIEKQLRNIGIKLSEII